MASTDYPAEHKQSRAPEYGSTPPHVTETAVEARQGVTGQGVSTVLIVSVVAVVVAFVVIYAVFFH